MVKTHLRWCPRHKGYFKSNAKNPSSCEKCYKRRGALKKKKTDAKVKRCHYKEGARHCYNKIWKDKDYCIRHYWMAKEEP
jgi:hypothetical protein